MKENRLRAARLCMVCAAFCLITGCGPRATMLRDPSIIGALTPTPAASGTPQADQKGSGEAYHSAVLSIGDGRCLAVSLPDYPIAFNAHAERVGFSRRLPEDLGIGDKRTVRYTFDELTSLTISMDGGWITRIEFLREAATLDDFDDIRAGGIATLLAADPVLSENDIAHILEEMGLDDESEALSGEVDYDELSFSWEITDEDGIIFSAEPTAQADAGSAP